MNSFYSNIAILIHKVIILSILVESIAQLDKNSKITLLEWWQCQLTKIMQMSKFSSCEWVNEWGRKILTDKMLSDTVQKFKKMFTQSLSVSFDHLVQILQKHPAS